VSTAESIDKAARREIRAALRGGSNDPALYAAAMMLAFSSRTRLHVGVAQARGWFLGLQLLIDEGHLDAAAYAAPRLQAKLPGRKYLDSLAVVFESLPAAVGGDRDPFVDQPTRDVQIVRQPGADTLLIDFCGAGKGPGLPIHLMDRWLARLGVHIVYLRDRRRIGYTGGIPVLGHNIATTVVALTRIADDLGARRIVCLGNSAGGSGALRYAGPLGAHRVLALVPITGGPEYTRRVTPHLEVGAPFWWGDLTGLYRNETGIRAHLLYGEHNEGDRQQCRRMVGLPGVTVEALPDWDEHHLVVALIRANRLERTLGWLIETEEAET